MAQHHVVIVTDSRFRGVEDYLLQNHIPGSSTTTVKVVPGGSLMNCFHTVKSSFHRIKKSNLPDLPLSLTIAAGICDFTTKVKNGPVSELSYPKSKIDSVIATLDSISGMASIEFQTPIRFSTKPPANMFRYREHQFRRHKHIEPSISDEVLLAQQKQLECDIGLANDHIY